ncbi:ABC transporter substrate-binding protein [Nocardioides panaciterrulae]|uniref:Peptide/nickel transport system substrate-binding protein n=1 Tax=Nocardioides panaciterrulae TaxID=661492 RepID=A0A7Y9E7Q0_9ACTN|nr:ABC transporter substrate-binding protein [Nocardioides panaciterrulae]NYD42748.1 peptide/nickel transport system substrate-binding protein [Nocardioides panaciterrulae]
MRLSKPLAALAGVTMFSLAACGGSGGAAPSARGSYKDMQGSVAQDPNRTGPAPEVVGARTGGTVTVYVTKDPGFDDLDPSNAWSALGNTLLQDFTSRSLTQYSRDPKTGDMVLVPDLATDLGHHNADYTEWTFTIRKGARWEDGSPVTAKQVAFGISRSMDTGTFPGGPGTEYSQTYFKGAGSYKGPYSDPGARWDGVTVDGDKVTIHMARPFADMPYWGAFPAMGAVPLGKASNPPDYGLHPMSDGPYKVQSFGPNEELELVRNNQWDAKTDAGRHQYVDKWVIKFNQDQAKVDQIMLSGNAMSQTALSTALGSSNYNVAKAKLGDRLVQTATQCGVYLEPDYTKITDIRVRKAIAYAYPYDDKWLSEGNVPGVTRVPADSIMPPAMAGKHDYFVDGQQFTYDPEEAKELLKQAGYAPGEFQLTMMYYEPDALAVASQKVLVKGLENAGFKVKSIPVQESVYAIATNPDDPVNKQLNVRYLSWCADWPTGLTMLPPMVRSGAAYNFSHFSEKSIDERMSRISSLPLGKQADAWGALDEEIGRKYLPIIPTAFRNELFPFGSRIGNASGDTEMGMPNFKDLYVK